MKYRKYYHDMGWKIANRGPVARLLSDNVLGEVKYPWLYRRFILAPKAGAK